MTDKDISTMHRTLGKIEGVAFVVADRFKTPLLDAIEVIDCILEREEGADNDR